MKEFLGEDFLFDNQLAISLYEKNKDLPIFDYHCHLSAEVIYYDKKFKNITRLWLCDNGKGDHYKWRLMRASGIKEDYITGNAPDFDKFNEFAKIMPLLIGNPIYEWCHLELKKYFGINKVISKDTAKEIYDLTEQKLSNLSCQDFIKESNVTHILTTDDPLDDLKFHDKLADNNLSFSVFPCFRADNLLNIESDSFLDYLNSLEVIENRKIKNIFELKQAIESRLLYFIKHKCLAADIGINNYLPYEYIEESTVNNIFNKRLNNETLNAKEIDGFKTNMLLFMLEMFSKHQLVCELHIGPLRNVSEINFEKLGKDSGYDCENNQSYASNLAKLLSKAEKRASIPKLIIFPINENDYDSILSVIASFTSNQKGSIQLGAAWWFNDNYDGIITNLRKHANYLPIANFIGMLTDSRSFTSYIRHDYFRRILCSFLSNYVYAGRYPKDMEQLNLIVRKIFFENAKEFFLKDE